MSRLDLALLEGVSQVDLVDNTGGKDLVSGAMQALKGAPLVSGLRYCLAALLFVVGCV